MTQPKHLVQITSYYVLNDPFAFAKCQSNYLKHIFESEATFLQKNEPESRYGRDEVISFCESSPAASRSHFYINRIQFDPMSLISGFDCFYL